MIGFLKNFFANEKSPEEKGMLAQAEAEKTRDILVVNAYGQEDDEEEEEEGACGTSSGCGGCGCRS